MLAAKPNAPVTHLSTACLGEVPSALTMLDASVKALTSLTTVTVDLLQQALSMLAATTAL